MRSSLCDRVIITNCLWKRKMNSSAALILPRSYLDLRLPIHWEFLFIFDRNENVFMRTCYNSTCRFSRENDKNTSYLQPAYNGNTINNITRNSIFSYSNQYAEKRTTNIRNFFGKVEESISTQTRLPPMSSIRC